MIDDIKVTNCAWCPDFNAPDPKAHPGGQRAHVITPELAVPDTGRDGRHRHPEIRGILYGLLFSAPFWALLAWALR
jgi:hypothetical protein